MPSRIPRTPSPDRDGDSSSPTVRPAAPDPPENEDGWPITPPRHHRHHRRRNALTAATAPVPLDLQRLRRAATHGNPRADLAQMIHPSIEHDSSSDDDGGDSDDGEGYPRLGQDRRRPPTRRPNPFAPGFRERGERYRVHRGDDRGPPSSPDEYGWPVTHNPPPQPVVVVDQALPPPSLTATAGSDWSLTTSLADANPFAATGNYAVQPPSPEWMRNGRHAQAPRTRPPINQDRPAEAESPASSTSSQELPRVDRDLKRHRLFAATHLCVQTRRRTARLSLLASPLASPRKSSPADTPLLLP
ncbi:hypothetical protein RTG_00735 [Rhodotorula toruloides ATCC 204091]|uniref:Uncharacterized protein n=1 Tax=Rhodotorula toruloides TaxID=5286 RepID=A0A0K3CQB3_RHOTO|nr:hypothetical protein RTG_00735 [Rhodotorula toruloides ATCC 204091]PRQ70328.1 hypothetical protein AAT19DRAFT_11077 [Rhodotorula toruloides]